MKKENIKKYVGAGVLSIAILAGAGLGITEATTDHTHEWCPLNSISIFGVQHQIDKVNGMEDFVARPLEVNGEVFGIEVNEHYPYMRKLVGMEYQDGKLVYVYSNGKDVMSSETPLASDSQSYYVTSHIHRTK